MDNISIDMLEYPFDNVNILKNKKKLKRYFYENIKRDGINVKIAILSGSTIGDITDILEIFLLKNNIIPEFYIGEYNRYYEQALFENNSLDEFKPDIIYIHTSNRNIELFPRVYDDDVTCNEKLMEEYGKFESVWQELHKKYNCLIIQNNFELLPYRIYGNSDIYFKSGGNNFIHNLNSMFYDYARNNNKFYINDINYLSSWTGNEKWLEAKYWHLYKYCLNPEYIPDLCNNIANIIKSLMGKNKKALVLDLDNTLWGGVIGDDGVDNIQIGKDSPSGSVFLEFQNYIKKLGEIGILLNVCSKNQIQTAKTGLDSTLSVLKSNDFICFKANWNEKYLNIMDIIDELNIMTDSVVFIDDNQVERESVKFFIPDIVTLEITNPDGYLTKLDKSAYFEITNLTKDDMHRSKQYKENMMREKHLLKYSDYNDYLKSLDMSAKITNIKKEHIDRVVQLFGKTNQFNMTNKKYSYNDIERIMADGNYITLCSNLRDKFGDNGLVTVLIGEMVNDIFHIENWIMSCRVFKRNLEFAIFDDLILYCKERLIKNIVGTYIKTSKNNYVENLYPKLGFDLSAQGEKHTIWEFKIPNDFENKNNEIEVERID